MALVLNMKETNQRYGSINCRFNISNSEKRVAPYGNDSLIVPVSYCQVTGRSCPHFVAECDCKTIRLVFSVDVWIPFKPRCQLEEAATCLNSEKIWPINLASPPSNAIDHRFPVTSHSRRDASCHLAAFFFFLWT